MARIRGDTLAVGFLALGLIPTSGHQSSASAVPASAAPAPVTPVALHIDTVGPARPGAVVTLRVRGPAGMDAVAGSMFGQPIRLYPDTGGETWLGLLGIDLDIAPGAHAVSLTGSHLGTVVASGRQNVQVVARRFPTRRLRVDSRFVEPPPGEAERIVREAARLATLFRDVTERRWDGPFRTPLAAAPNSNFGTRSVFNGQPRNPHAGVDFAGPTGTPIVAPNAAAVVLAENLYFTGNTVVLDHGLGLYSLYAHLSRIDVTPGGVVTTGQRLGLLGATGRVTGPHLHWAVRLNGARVDPLSLLAALEARPRVEPASPATGRARRRSPSGRL
jgi:hypothetical protein